MVKYNQRLKDLVTVSLATQMFGSLLSPMTRWYHLWWEQAGFPCIKSSLESPTIWVVSLSLSISTEKKRKTDHRDVELQREHQAVLCGRAKPLPGTGTGVCFRSHQPVRGTALKGPKQRGLGLSYPHAPSPQGSTSFQPTEKALLDHAGQFTRENILTLMRNGQSR